MVDIRDWSVLHVGGIGDGRMGVPEHARSNIIPQNDCWAVLSAPLGEAGTAVEIAGVVLVGVGFALETDVAVGVAFAEQPPYPLQYVENIERHIPQLAHLRGVDQFVVQVSARHLRRLALDKKHAEQVDGEKSAEGYEAVVDYLHLINGLSVRYSGHGRLWCRP